MRATAAGALGPSASPELAHKLHEDLRAADPSDARLLQNLAVALGELKVAASFESLVGVAKAARVPGVKICAAHALGKMGRGEEQAEKLERFASRATSDILEAQAWTAALSQVRARSHWGIEDYLARLFEAPSVHPALPRELGSFSEEEVYEGLKIYAPKEVGVGPHLQRMCLALIAL